MQKLIVCCSVLNFNNHDGVLQAVPQFLPIPKLVGATNNILYNNDVREASPLWTKVGQNVAVVLSSGNLELFTCICQDALERQ